MCELLALSSSQPVRLTFSLETLAARGGLSGRSHDGWGVAFYQGTDVAQFREPAAATDSALVRLLASEGPVTTLAISHIRHATQGAVSLVNTQPFTRELGGRTHVFAHNGDLPGIYQAEALGLVRYRPVGQTDSERAFCALLERLSALWTASHPPPLEARLALVADFAAELRVLGPANFIYADSDTLFAHGHRRLQPASRRAEPPGLWLRQRRCPPADPAPDRQAGVSVVQEEQTVVWIASVPLTEDDWRPLAEGEVLAVRDGALVGRTLLMER
jgi:predicted glutamine amidotransferase